MTCIGAVLGTQIKIKAPPVNEDIYVGRKPYGHYMNIQLVCDANLRFLDAVVKWPGSVNDKTIWKNCGLKERMDDFLLSQPRNYKGWLIGDSGYELRPHMMIPYLDPASAGEMMFNKHHKKCRCTIERAIGTLKFRFRCTCKQSGGAIPFDVEIFCQIIMSCVVLHNYCRNRNIPFPIAADIEDDIREENEAREAAARQGPNSQPSNNSLLMGFMTRKLITDTYFK